MHTNQSYELKVIFNKPRLVFHDNSVERAAADIQLVFTPKDGGKRKSSVFEFIAPIGLLEADDLRWYLESYHIWPVGLFKERAEGIEEKLPEWGSLLLSAITRVPTAHEILQSWVTGCSDAKPKWRDLLLSARGLFQNRAKDPVDSQPILSLKVNVEDSPSSRIAASRIVALPWELLLCDDVLTADDSQPKIRRDLLASSFGSIFNGSYKHKDTIRILTLSPRPEQAGYIDHRISIAPLLDSLEALGEHAELVRVSPPTFERLEEELNKAQQTGTSFHILHFDGHGVFNAEKGEGALCFEHKIDDDKLLPEFSHLVYADELAELLSGHSLPLVFLEACQTAQSDAKDADKTDPNASVAGALLQADISSVIAMSHSVLVETARRFVGTFYQNISAGKSIGTSVSYGQQALRKDTERINIPGAGKLEMQDWFVPVLYQSQDDPSLFAEDLKLSHDTSSELILGDLPDTPEHTFIGRSRELLALERLLEREPYAVIRGQGGIGKTTIAVELSRWLVYSGHFDSCAFVCVEDYSHGRAVLDVLGKQLVGDSYSVAEYGDDREKALQPLLRALENVRCLIVVDNLESLLGGKFLDNLQEVFAVLSALNPAPSLPLSRGKPSPHSEPDIGASLLFTSRESLPKPFNNEFREIELDALSQTDAKALVLQVMNSQGLALHRDDQGNDPEEVNALVNSVGCHARSLVLLARELANDQSGVVATTEKVQRIMQKLHQQHPRERELSLFASVELSLQRLPDEVRAVINGLAVFHDGSNINSIAQVLFNDESETASLRKTNKVCQGLIQVGLAQIIGDYEYVRFDPALPAYLALSLDEEELEEYQYRWMAVTWNFIWFIYNHQFQNAKLSEQHNQQRQNPRLSRQLTQQELPNLMAHLHGVMAQLDAGQVETEGVLEQLMSVEHLLSGQNQPQALAQVVVWQEKVAQDLVEWSSASFQSKAMALERQVDLQESYQIAEALLKQSLQAGEQAYSGAGFDLALAHFHMGNVLVSSDLAEEAMPYFQQSQQRFTNLGNKYQTTSQMAAKSLSSQGGCLLELGRLEEAAAVYEETIGRLEKLKDTYAVANGKSQLASVYTDQKRYEEALSLYKEVLVFYEQLGEPDGIANSLHNIGMVHKYKENFELGEQAFRQSMMIAIQHRDQGSEANSLTELGSLYKRWKGPEQSVNFYKQAIEIYVSLGDLGSEGSIRSNLADMLFQLERFDEARSELLRAIECQQGLGYELKPWYTWDILYDLERAVGNHQAARHARQQALETFLAYRRDGGENHTDIGRICMAVWDSIQQEDTREVEQIIASMLSNPKQNNQGFFHKLQAMIDGERGMYLLEDEDLTYDWAAELILLLEGLRS